MALELEQIDIDSENYWRMYLDCRRRTQRLWNALNDRAELDRFEAEYALFSFRMWIESFVAMVRYGLRIDQKLSRQAKRQYLPKQIMAGDKGRLSAVRLISLNKFVELPPDAESNIGFTFEYETFYRLDVEELASIHGQLGNFAHVSSAQPDEESARKLLARCYVLYGQIAPLMKRHLLEVRGHSGASEANIDGIHLVVGQDDDGRDWLIETRGGQMSIRVRPP